MANSTRKSRPKKPAKPHPDFPLFPHTNGKWAKKVKGKMFYFGSWADSNAALEEWSEHKEHILLHGEKKRDDGSDGSLTIKGLADHFLTAKKNRLDSGELSARTFRGYYDTLQFLADTLGKSRPVTALRACEKIPHAMPIDLGVGIWFGKTLS